MLGIFFQRIPFLDGLSRRGVPDAFSGARTLLRGIIFRRRFLGGFADKDFFCPAPLRPSPVVLAYPR
jgi:hypothetical protein